MSINRNNWNLTERKELLTQLKEGKRPKEIAQNLNRTYEAVKAKVKNLAAEGIIEVTGHASGTKYRVKNVAEVSVKVKTKTKTVTPKAALKSTGVREYSGGHIVYNNRLYKEVN